MSRESKNNYYLNIAKEVSKRSTCLRRHYGAIIVNNDEIIATGYNGAPRGEENCCDRGSCPRMDKEHNTGDYSDCPAVHAEQNAMLSASRRDMIGSTLYLYGENVRDTLNIVTQEMENSDIESPEPCPICMRMIKNAGIRYVINNKGVFDLQSKITDQYSNISSSMIDIEEVTLLSIEEYEESRENIPLLNEDWWLRSSGYGSNSAVIVDYCSCVNLSGSIVDINYYVVRPVLRISNLESLNLREKDTFRLAGHDWTVISGELAICNDHIGNHIFREDWRSEDANDYKRSDVKKYLDTWARDTGLMKN